MTTYNTSEFKSGLKFLMEGEPCSIIENEFVKPGKGQAFNRVKFRHLKTGRVLEKTFKSGDSVPAADVVECEVQYLYNDGEYWHFMDTSTYDQFTADKTMVEDAAPWLMEQDICTLMLWNGQPLQIIPPNFVVLEVIETDPGLKGDTSGGGSKPARFKTGAVVRVPLFIHRGDLLKIDTRTGTYVSRASKE